MQRPALILALVFLTLGCGKKEAPAASPDSPAPHSAEASSVAATAPAAPQTGASATSAPPRLMTVTGVVEETFGASDYTYMRLKTADGEVWAAVTKATVKKGEHVTVVDAAPMDGFESKTLKRRFDRIVFGSLGPKGAAPAAAPVAAGHSAEAGKEIREQMAAQHAAAASGPADVGKIEVKKAEGPNGKTVVELFAGRAALKDKEVAVRGKVVKFTPGVMGRNWIHLRDGTGSREKRNDDVTITTNDVVAVGDVIVIRGTVRLERDFGAGYAYPVLIEEARVAR